LFAEFDVEHGNPFAHKIRGGLSSWNHYTALLHKTT
jgi:hypothetical protein